MRTKQVGPSQLRSFGFIVGGGFALIDLLPLVRHHPMRLWALVISVLLVATALVWPSALRPFQRVWMTIGEGLGWVNSRIILSIVYYLIIVPIGLLRRAFGQDPMSRQLEPNATTYRVV